MYLRVDAAAGAQVRREVVVLVLPPYWQPAGAGKHFARGKPKDKL